MYLEEVQEGIPRGNGKTVAPQIIEYLSEDIVNSALEIGEPILIIDQSAGGTVVLYYFPQFVKAALFRKPYLVYARLFIKVHELIVQADILVVFIVFRN